jgi:glutathione S-transferase
VILIGQYDSPFVRRVAIALNHYGLPYEHRPWSVWANADDIARYNPLRRVPTLVLDDGECLLDSFAILDALDEMIGAPRALLPRTGSRRREGLRVCALAMGVADKAVSLLYEPLLREQPSRVWIERCARQIHDGLSVLEEDRARRRGDWWLNDCYSHADIAVSCALCFVREAQPHLIEAAKFPALTAHAQRCEGMAEFAKVVQPLTVSLSR